MITVDELKKAFTVVDDQDLAPLFGRKKGAVSAWRKNGVPAAIEIKARELLAQQPSPASPSAHVSVPRYEVQASAGGGAVVASEQIVDYLQFRPDWLKTVKGITPGNLILISVIGDSMEPTINDGDLILVDTTEGRFKSDAIYVMRQGDRLWVKRVHYKVDGSVLVKSDNVDKYEPELFRGDELENLRIVGRVVWRGGSL